MTWYGYCDFVEKINETGGISLFCKKFQLNELVVCAYVDKQRTPNHMTRIALAAIVGVSIDTFA